MSLLLHWANAYPAWRHFVKTNCCSKVLDVCCRKGAQSSEWSRNWTPQFTNALKYMDEQEKTQIQAFYFDTKKVFYDTKYGFLAHHNLFLWHKMLLFEKEFKKQHFFLLWKTGLVCVCVCVCVCQKQIFLIQTNIAFWHTQIMLFDKTKVCFFTHVHTPQDANVKWLHLCTY